VYCCCSALQHSVYSAKVSSSFALCHQLQCHTGNHQRQHHHQHGEGKGEGKGEGEGEGEGAVKIMSSLGGAWCFS